MLNEINQGKKTNIAWFLYEVPGKANSKDRK